MLFRSDFGAQTRAYRKGANVDDRPTAPPRMTQDDIDTFLADTVGPLYEEEPTVSDPTTQADWYKGLLPNWQACGPWVPDDDLTDEGRRTKAAFIEMLSSDSRYAPGPDAERLRALAGELVAALKALAWRHGWIPQGGPCVCNEHLAAHKALAAAAAILTPKEEPQ